LIRINEFSFQLWQIVLVIEKRGDDRSDVKQTTAGFRGPLKVQSLTSAKRKFLSLGKRRSLFVALLRYNLKPNTEEFMNKYNRLLTSIVISFTLSGCAGLADSMNKIADLGVVSEGVSTFDDAIIIKVTPNWLFETDTQWVKTKLGAHWTSTAPDYVALIMSYGSDVRSGTAYLVFTGIDINIDGKILSYKTNTQTSIDSSSYNTISNTFYTESKNSVVMPLATLLKMVKAKDCRLRIYTSKGYEDITFNIERSASGQSTALVSLREFLAKVSSVK